MAGSSGIVQLCPTHVVRAVQDSQSLRIILVENMDANEICDFSITSFPSLSSSFGWFLCFFLCFIFQSDIREHLWRLGSSFPWQLRVGLSPMNEDPVTLPDDGIGSISYQATLLLPSQQQRRIFGQVA